MAVLNIDNLLGKGKNRIAKVGIEVEGVWAKGKLPKGAPLQRDTSVKDFPDHIIDSSAGIGEIASPPMMPILIEPWVERNYPTHINETCGLHIHQSFESALNYMRLMVPDYQDTMIHYLKLWAVEEKLRSNHCFWDRLAGKSEYCQLKFWPDKQVRAVRKDYDRIKDGHRYTAINYCHGLHNMQTVEVRVLPMFDTPQQSVRSLLRVVDITNACLVALGKKERPLVAEFDLSNSRKSFVDSAVSLYR